MEAVKYAKLKKQPLSAVVAHKFVRRSKVGLVVESKFEQAMTAVQVQFVADVKPVVFDGFDADPEQLCDFFAGTVFGNEFEDAAFGWSQAVNLRSG